MCKTRSHFFFSFLACNTYYRSSSHSACASSFPIHSSHSTIYGADNTSAETSLGLISVTGRLAVICHALNAVSGPCSRLTTESFPSHLARHPRCPGIIVSLNDSWTLVLNHLNMATPSPISLFYLPRDVASGFRLWVHWRGSPKLFLQQAQYPQHALC